MEFFSNLFSSSPSKEPQRSAAPEGGLVELGDSEEDKEHTQGKVNHNTLPPRRRGTALTFCGSVAEPNMPNAQC